MAVQQSIVKYLNIAREFPETLSEYRRMLAQNLFLLNLLRTGRNTEAVAAFLNGQTKTYQDAEKILNEIAQKHTVARQLIDKYPEFKESFPGFIGADIDLSMLDAPVIAAITLLTGSILTLYDDITYRIKAQNVLLTRLQEERQKLNDGIISQEEYDNFLKSTEAAAGKVPIVNMGGVLVITSLIFGGYYVINNYDKVEKTLRKALKT